MRTRTDRCLVGVEQPHSAAALDAALKILRKQVECAGVAASIRRHKWFVSPRRRRRLRQIENRRRAEQRRAKAEQTTKPGG